MATEPLDEAITDSLIDSCAEGLIKKPAFEPRRAGVRPGLRPEPGTARTTEEQARSLQRVIGKLNLFADTM